MTTKSPLHNVMVTHSFLQWTPGRMCSSCDECELSVRFSLMRHVQKMNLPSEIMRFQEKIWYPRRRENSSSLRCLLLSCGFGRELPTIDAGHLCFSHNAFFR
ncbi:hypothetical protein PO909_021603 [Leuciscus waleckii]